MRRALGVLALLAIAALWTGCGGSSSNSTTTTTNSVGTTSANTSATTPSKLPDMSNEGGTSTGAAPKGTPPTGIKPPTSK